MSTRRPSKPKTRQSGPAKKPPSRQYVRRARTGRFISENRARTRKTPRSVVMPSRPARRGSSRIVPLEESAAVAPHDMPRPTVADVVRRAGEGRPPLDPSHIVLARPVEETARVLGTGIEVWEIYKTYLEVGQDEARLRRAYHWLTEAQIADALGYAADHRAAILGRIREDYQHLPKDERPPILV